MTLSSYIGHLKKADASLLMQALGLPMRPEDTLNNLRRKLRTVSHGAILRAVRSSKFPIGPIHHLQSYGIGVENQLDRQLRQEPINCTNFNQDKTVAIPNQMNHPFSTAQIFPETQPTDLPTLSYQYPTNPPHLTNVDNPEEVEEQEFDPDVLESASTRFDGRIDRFVEECRKEGMIYFGRSDELEEFLTELIHKAEESELMQSEVHGAIPNLLEGTARERFVRRLLPQWDCIPCNKTTDYLIELFGNKAIVPIAAVNIKLSWLWLPSPTGPKSK